MSTPLKETVLLPKTDFPMKANGWLLLLTMVAFFGGFSIAFSNPLEKSGFSFLGSFYGERPMEERSETFQVDLWRDGSVLVGLYTSSVGSQGSGEQPDIIQRISGTYNVETQQVLLQHDTAKFGFRYQGKLKSNRLTGELEDGDKFKQVLIKSKDKLNTSAISAPTSSKDEWFKWSEKRLDLWEEKSWRYTQESKACENGEGLVCAGLGDRAQFRGKMEKAKQYWEKACKLNNPRGCKSSGQKERWLELQTNRCTWASPSLDRNIACQDLAETSEKEGNMGEAKKWYRLGCNGFEFPFTCCDQLKKMSFSSEETAHLKTDCAKDDFTACFILANTPGLKEEETHELYKKACKGVAVACRRESM